MAETKCVCSVYSICSSDRRHTIVETTEVKDRIDRQREDIKFRMDLQIDDVAFKTLIADTQVLTKKIHS